MNARSQCKEELKIRTYLINSKLISMFQVEELYWLGLQVDVGDFIHFKSCVLFTQLDDPKWPLINVEVVAHVTRPELRSCEVSSGWWWEMSCVPWEKVVVCFAARV